MFGKNKQEVNEIEIVEEGTLEDEKDIKEPLDQDEEEKIVEEIKAEEDSEDNVEIVVVKELPVQPVRFTTRDDGTKVKFITIEEALGEILNS